MSRPAVSVVVPFAGTSEHAKAVIAMLLGLERRDGDQLIVADNSGTVPPLPAIAGTLLTDPTT